MPVDLGRYHLSTTPTVPTKYYEKDLYLIEEQNANNFLSHHTVTVRSLLDLDGRLKRA
jgi:hypothetical protein